MKIWVNNQTTEVLPQSTVTAVIEQFGATGPFAVALNGQFVTKADYGQTQVNEGDKLEVLSPISGG